MAVYASTAINRAVKHSQYQGGKRLGDETSASEQKGVMQWTGIKFGARSRLLPWVSSIILVIYEVPEKRRLWFIFSLSYPP